MEIRLKMLIRRYPLFQRPITLITDPDIAEWRDTRLIHVSAPTVNREPCLISSVFTQAMKEWCLGLTAKLGAPNIERKWRTRQDWTMWPIDQLS